MDSPQNMQDSLGLTRVEAALLQLTPAAPSQIPAGES